WSSRRPEYASWATHENYLVPPDFFDELTLPEYNYYRRGEPSPKITPRMGLWLAFLISRIYGGSGKMSSEMKRGRCDYQLFQRADFIEMLHHHDTTHRRALINTRDHSYANPRKYRRLHVI